MVATTNDATTVVSNGLEETSRLCKDFPQCKVPITGMGGVQSGQEISLVLTQKVFGFMSNLSSCSLTFYMDEEATFTQHLVYGGALVDSNLRPAIKRDPYGNVGLVFTAVCPSFSPLPSLSVPHSPCACLVSTAHTHR